MDNFDKTMLVTWFTLATTGANFLGVAYAYGMKDLQVILSWMILVSTLFFFKNVWEIEIWGLK